MLRLIFLLILFAGLALGQAMPKFSSVEPGQGKAGDELTVSGENLDAKHVSEIFLTDGKTDVKLTIVAQNATSIKFKIPDSAKQGRFALMLMTAGSEPKLIEQPVKVTVQ